MQVPIPTAAVVEATTSDVGIHTDPFSFSGPSVMDGSSTMDNVWDDLPPAGSQSYPAPAYAPAPPPYAQNPAQASANQYLADAQQYHRQRELEERQGKQTSGGMFASESSIINSGTIGGGLAMLGAIVWFFGGLAVGVIFFYPPILFIIGLVGFIKGLVNR